MKQLKVLQRSVGDLFFFLWKQEVVSLCFSQEKKEISSLGSEEGTDSFFVRMFIE